MILIADSGSTKTDWAAVREDGQRILFRSLGYNPNYISGEEIRSDIIASMPTGLDPEKVTEVYFYGAGVTELQYPFVREVLGSVFTKSGSIFVQMDLLASARALLGRASGFAAILGTGTNTCLYDGERVTMNIDSLGFILGDEGSGGYLGKRLICDFIRGDIPDELRPMTAEVLGKNGDELIDQIYTRPFPNRYCAQFSKFIAANLGGHPYFRGLVVGSFRAFFENIVTHYPDYRRHELNCVGSVGFHYRDILAEVASDYGMRLGRVLEAPMEGLIEFHARELIDNQPNR